MNIPPNNNLPPIDVDSAEFDSADRLESLLALDLTAMLDEAERAELESLLASRPDGQPLERALAETAAHFTLASASPESPAPPLDPALQSRLLASAAAYLVSPPATPRPQTTLPFPPPPAPKPVPRPSPFRTLFAAGGYALAACLALIFILQNRAPSTPDLSSPRTALITRDGISPIAWKATDPNNPASGDVVWSPTKQSGVMRFVNFKPNDPTQSQYQLWIFDRARPEATPVDGGVFNIPPPSPTSSSPEVLIPIKPTLPVSQAFLFAITEEPPGGVVVSDRKRLHLIAPTPPTP